MDGLNQLCLNDGYSISKKNMVTIAHKLRFFFDTVVFFIWGQSTLEVVSDIASQNIKISLIDDYIKFMFSFVGLAYLLFKLFASIRIHILDYRMKLQDLREKKLKNDKLEDNNKNIE
mgnify:FL=1